MTDAYAGRTGADYDSLLDELSAVCASNDPDTLHALYGHCRSTGPREPHSIRRRHPGPLLRCSRGAVGAWSGIEVSTTRPPSTSATRLRSARPQASWDCPPRKRTHADLNLPDRRWSVASPARPDEFRCHAVSIPGGNVHGRQRTNAAAPRPSLRPPTSTNSAGTAAAHRRAEADLRDLPPEKRTVILAVFAGQPGCETGGRWDSTVPLPHALPYNNHGLIDISGDFRRSNGWAGAGSNRRPSAFQADARTD